MFQFMERLKTVLKPADWKAPIRMFSSRFASLLCFSSQVSLVLMFNIKVKPSGSVLLRSPHRDNFSNSCQQSQPVCPYSLHHVAFPLQDREDLGFCLDHISTSHSHTFSRRRAELPSPPLCASVNVGADWLNEAAACGPNLLRKLIPSLSVSYLGSHLLDWVKSLLSPCIPSSVLQKPCMGSCLRLRHLADGPRTQLDFNADDFTTCGAFQ